MSREEHKKHTIEVEDEPISFVLVDKNKQILHKIVFKDSNIEYLKNCKYPNFDALTFIVIRNLIKKIDIMEEKIYRIEHPSLEEQIR